MPASVVECFQRNGPAWITCLRHMRKDWRETGTAHPNCLQLICIVECSQLFHGREAEVNWYTGGNSYVTINPAVAVPGPGVYLAKAKFAHKKGEKGPSDDEEAGPEIPVASILQLTRLGTTGDFMTMANECKKTLGKKKFDLLKQMSVSYTHLRAHETGRSRMPSSA